MDCQMLKAMNHTHDAKLQHQCLYNIINCLEIVYSNCL